MIVFKNYLKIAIKYLPVMLVFTIMLTFFSILASTSNNTSKIFEETKSKIAVINNDGNAPLTESFITYIEKNATLVTLEQKEDAISDALFFRKVDEVITIPKGFSKELALGKEPKIETRKVPDSTTGIFSERVLSRFLNYANIYIQAGVPEKEIGNLLEKDLEKQASINLVTETTVATNQTSFFYNFANYTILAIAIFIIGKTMSSFRERNLHKRNTVAPLSYRKINFQLFLGNAFISFLLWLIYSGIAFVLFPQAMTSWNGIYFLLNSFIFVSVALSLGFLVGNLVENREAQSGIINVLALGTSFICGAFVPQQFLGDFVLTLAKFFPSYWYIANNDKIAELSNFTWSNCQPLLINMLIMIGFTIFFFIITNVISRIKRKEG